MGACFCTGACFKYGRCGATKPEPDLVGWPRRSGKTGWLLDQARAELTDEELRDLVIARINDGSPELTKLCPSD